MQYWQDIVDNKAQLIVVTDEAVYAQTMDVANCQRQVEELNAGKSPATLFGSGATHVVLRTVSKVERESTDDEIRFTSRVGKEDKQESLSIDDAGIRGQVFFALEQATQGRFKRYDDQYNRPRAAFGSLLALTIFGFGTKMLASAAAAIQHADDLQISGRKKGLKQLLVWILDLLGPTGVTVIGLSLCALTIAHLVMRMKKPPLMHILQIQPYHPQGSLTVAIKYLFLGAIWVLFLPALLG